MVVRGSEDLKKLTDLQIGQHQLPILRKTSHDLLLSLKGLLLAQQASLERQAMAGVKPAADDNQVSFRQEYNPVTLSQGQASLSRVLPQEFAYTSPIREGQEDEAEIREIAALVHELAVVLNDFWTSFGRQGHIIDDIETNITLVLSNALQNSAQDDEYHLGMIRRAGYLIFILVVVVAVVLLAVTF
ncbi:hypothetical protein BDZ94DRAFT_1256623 [Collybia nuda]|uniref:Uncharacterized protein n=1 Tax=Collybia nuda TaxID=64659 RepID=A0A9P5Y7Q7_9AGAR|nr:hypothetical protein BDZ94DRAFT_1256623 [Collybia nuda]